MTTQHDPDAATAWPACGELDAAAAPEGITLDGRYCRLVPLSADDHGADLFAANAKDTPQRQGLPALWPVRASG